MKRIISCICLLVLCLSFVSLTVFAAGASASASGPKSVKMEQSFNVTLSVNGSNIHGLQGKINYDDSALRINSVKTTKDGWAVDSYNNNFAVYDNDGEHPVNQKTKVLVLNVTLLKGNAGDKVTVKFGSLVATDAENDLSVNGVSYAFTIAEEPTEPTTEPTEPATKPTKPTTKPTKPVAKPTEPATKPTKPTEPATEPTEATTQPTESATEPTEAVTQPTEPVTEPTQPVVTPGEVHKCIPWWFVIFVAISGAAIGYIFRAVIEKKFLNID